MLSQNVTQKKMLTLNVKFQHNSWFADNQAIGLVVFPGFSMSSDERQHIVATNKAFFEFCISII